MKDQELLQLDPESEVKDFMILATTGMGVIGNAMERDGDAVAVILTGAADLDIRCASLLQKKTDFPEQVMVKDLLTEEVSSHIENIKNCFRRMIQNAINKVAKEDAHRQAAEAEAIRAKWKKELHSPSEHGTVAEICAKYGVSKSEVRKHKSAGTLDEFLASK